MTTGRDLVKGSTDSLVLYLISEKPMYGYQIIKELEKKSQGYFKFKEGTLYPALHRLENTGLIDSQWEILPGGRNRRYYRITTKGQRTLAEKRSQWRDFLVAINLVLQPGTSDAR
ncbi:MAG: PadR family transcriptional regulator [Dehalococcoidales bacterium]|nr:PadR family transcriptional regulator [Dehalococcoidales bacterium]